MGPGEGNTPRMPLLAAFVLATPVFGFSLSVDPALLMAAPISIVVAAAAEGELEVGEEQELAAVDDDGEPAADAEVDAVAQPALEDAVVAEDPEDAENVADAPATQTADADASPSSDDIANALKRRAKIANVHKWMGISTWISMTATVLFGIIQYRNLYGFFAGRDDNPCTLGNAFPNQDACSGRPWYHTVSAGMTSVLYFTTFGLSFAMPDPIGLDQGSSKAARNLRKHKRLRWAHLGGMGAQILLGILSGSSHRIGLDRANDYGGQQALATTHLLIGAATYVTLTWSGAIMLK
jgi:hypothetical protein